jgi:hypothetical protein
LAATSSVLSLALIFFIVSYRAPFEAEIGKTLAVRVQVQTFNDAEEIYFARVELPPGVHFSSEVHPELEAQRTLTLAWETPLKSSQLPLVIRAEQGGKKNIHISFLNAKKEVVGQKVITINFKAKV